MSFDDASAALGFWAAVIAFGGLALWLTVDRADQKASPAGTVLSIACWLTAFAALLAALTVKWSDLRLSAMAAELARIGGWLAFLFFLCDRQPRQKAAIHWPVALVTVLPAIALLRDPPSAWIVFHVGLLAGAAVGSALTLYVALRRDMLPPARTGWLLAGAMAGFGYDGLLALGRLSGPHAWSGALTDARGVFLALLAAVFVLGACRASWLHLPAGTYGCWSLAAGAATVLVLLATEATGLVAIPAAWASLPELPSLAQVTTVLSAAAPAQLPSPTWVALAIGVVTLAGTILAWRARTAHGDDPPPAGSFDYRHEWHRFIDTVTGVSAAAGPGGGSEDLPSRIVRAVADVVAAPGGALWLHVPPDRYELLAVRGLDPPRFRTGGAAGLAQMLLSRHDVVELGELAAVPNAPRWPDWLPRPPAAWLLLPLEHCGSLIGLIVLATPEVTRRLGRDERALLVTLARQAASYMAEEQARRALADSRRFADFTRHFAFIAHDLKNVKTQLELASENARRWRGNAEFYDDLVATLELTARRLGGLMDRLRRETSQVVDDTDLARLLGGLEQTVGSRRPKIINHAGALHARVDSNRLRQAIGHLVDNGFEAAGEQGEVSVVLYREGQMAIIEVSDDGPGMAPEFLRRWLFRPFVTTKPGGLGLGLVEARQIVEGLGGRLEVDSTPGRGTTMRIYVPCISAAA